MVLKIEMKSKLFQEYFDNELKSIELMKENNKKLKNDYVRLENGDTKYKLEREISQNNEIIEQTKILIINKHDLLSEYEDFDEEEIVRKFFELIEKMKYHELKAYEYYRNLDHMLRAVHKHDMVNVFVAIICLSKLDKKMNKYEGKRYNDVRTDDHVKVNHERDDVHITSKLSDNLFNVLRCKIDIKQKAIVVKR